jgi:hypothetical protein
LEKKFYIGQGYSGERCGPWASCSQSYDPWTWKNITNSQFSALFSFVLSDIHLIFGTVLCHTEIQIKFKFGFNSLIFLEVMAQWT